MKNALYLGFYIGWIDLKMISRKNFAGGSIQGRLMQLAGLIFIISFLVGLHFFAFALATFAPKAIPNDPEGALQGMSTLVWNFLIFVMASGGLIRAIVVLHEQDDVDLLVSSPVSVRTILAARLFGNALQSCAVDGFIILPWINAMILLHGPVYLLGYPVWMALAVLISSIDGLLTLSLIRFFGFNLARSLAQIIPFVLVFAVTFASFGATLSYGEISKEQPQVPPSVQMGIIRIGETPLAIFAQAASGSPLALLAVLALSFGSAWLTLKWTEKPFLDGLKSLQEGSSSTKSEHVPRPFSGNLLWLEVLKNYRMIFRTPMILVQSLSQALAPIGISMVFGKINAAYGFAYFIIFVSGVLSGILTIAAATVEPCTDLLLMSPKKEWLFKVGKMLTGCGFFCVVICGSALVFFACHKILAGLALLLAGLPLCLVNSYVGEVFAEPTPFGSRPKLLSSPMMIIPLFGMQLSSGIVATLSIVASSYNIILFIPCLLVCYIILFVAWALSQLKEPMF